MTDTPISEWEVIPNYFCKSCGNPARVSPTDGKVWGCADCNGATSDLMGSFGRISQDVLDGKTPAIAYKTVRPGPIPPEVLISDAAVRNYLISLEAGERVIETGCSCMNGRVGTVYISQNPGPSFGSKCVMWDDIGQGKMGTSATWGTRRLKDAKPSTAVSDALHAAVAHLSKTAMALSELDISMAFRTELQPDSTEMRQVIEKCEATLLPILEKLVGARCQKKSARCAARLAWVESMTDVIISSFGVLTFAHEYKPGDPRPSSGGYADLFEWAQVQVKAGLDQVRCGRCCLYKFPQELSGEIDETTAYNKRGRAIGILKSPICIDCAPWLKTRK